MCGPRGLPGDTNVLYHNNGDGTFADVSEKAGILKSGPRYSITAVSYDFDNDGWPDIYVAVDSQPSILYHNNHDGTFTDIAVAAGWPTARRVTNRPGWEWRLLITTVTAGSISSRRTSQTTLATVPKQWRWDIQRRDFPSGIAVNSRYVGWGCGFLDYDNDGWPDLMQINGHVYPEMVGHEVGETYKNPRIVYRNMGTVNSKMFRRSWVQASASVFRSRGAAFGDYDNDGRRRRESRGRRRLPRRPGLG